MELGGGRFTVTSPKVTLGSLGAVELVFGALSGLSRARVADFVGTAADSNAVTTLLAGASVVETELAALATLAGTLFFGYAVYEFLPRIFPQTLRAVAGRTGYRLLATGVVIATARVAESALGSSFTSAGLVLVPTVAALGLSLGYVTWVASRDTVDVEAASATTSEWIGSGSEATETATGGDARSPVDTLSDVVSVGVILALPVPILGLAVVAAGQVSPLPELLAIGWVAVDGVDRRSNRALSDRLPDQERMDVEGSMFDLVANAIRSQKGLPTVTLILVGFGVPVTLVGVLNGELGRFATEGVRAVGTDTLFAWSVLGMVVVLFASGLFAVWFWVRAIQRLPRYLRAWNGATTETSPLDGEDLPEPVTRPVGALLPVFVAYLPATLVTQMLRFDYYFGARTAVLGAYAVVWPLSVGLLAWATLRTRRSESQPPLSDGRLLPAALTVEWAMFLLTPALVGAVGRAAGTESWRLPSTDQGLFVFLLVAVVYIFVEPDIRARARGASGWRRHEAKVARVGFGAATLVLSTVGVLPDTAAFKLVGVVFLVWPFLTVAGDRVRAQAGA
jgi:hypothetical protein